VHNDVSPVLAQTFTDPFTVFSAKRFPGVPGEFKRFKLTVALLNIYLLDTTALSIAFGNQGQKIPLVSFLIHSFFFLHLPPSFSVIFLVYPAKERKTFFYQLFPRKAQTDANILPSLSFCQRNRHGPAKRRQRNSSSAEEDDSDEDAE
jgi:hypothetical protein